MQGSAKLGEFSSLKFPINFRLLEIFPEIFPDSFITGNGRTLHATLPTYNQPLLAADILAAACCRRALLTISIVITDYIIVKCNYNCKHNCNY